MSKANAKTTKAEEAKKAEETTGLVTVNRDVALPQDLDLGADYKDQVEAEELGLKDFSMPFIKLAQSLSDELDNQHEKHIKGLKAGDLFNSVTGEFWPTSPEREEGKQDHIIVVPAFVQPTYVEWTPRAKGGGFIKDHGLADGSAMMDAIKAANRYDPTTGHPLLDNGNELMETTYWFSLLIEAQLIQQVLFAFQSTGLSKTSRPWASLCSNLRGPNGEKVHRAYGCYTLAPKMARNDKGRWYVLKPAPFKLEDGTIVTTPMLENGVDIYRRAVEFSKDVKDLLDQGVTVVPDDTAQEPEAAQEAPATDAPSDADLEADKDNF